MLLIDSVGGTVWFGEQVWITGVELCSQLITNVLPAGIWFWFSFFWKEVCLFLALFQRGKKKGQMHFRRVAGVPLRLAKTNSHPVT